MLTYTTDAYFVLKEFKVMVFESLILKTHLNIAIICLESIISNILHFQDLFMTTMSYCINLTSQCSFIHEVYDIQWISYMLVI
jgi:hypothetical protein